MLKIGDDLRKLRQSGRPSKSFADALADMLYKERVKRLRDDKK
jgi:hypothetical protein